MLFLIIIIFVLFFFFFVIIFVIIVTMIVAINSIWSWTVAIVEKWRSGEARKWYQKMTVSNYLLVRSNRLGPHNPLPNKAKRCYVSKLMGRHAHVHHLGFSPRRLLECISFLIELFYQGRSHSFKMFVFREQLIIIVLTWRRHWSDHAIADDQFDGSISCNMFVQSTFTNVESDIQFNMIQSRLESSLNVQNATLKSWTFIFKIK